MRMLTAMLLTAASLLASTAIASHPYHVSLAEVERNAKTGNLQVALCVWPADLEKAISKKAGKIIDLDKAQKLDELLASYVESKFVVRDAANKVQKIRWVGHEMDLKEAWLYFEVKSADAKQLTVENRVFFELNEDQLNQVNFVAGKAKSSLAITADKPNQQLK